VTHTATRDFFRFYLFIDPCGRRHYFPKVEKKKRFGIGVRTELLIDVASFSAYGIDNHTMMRAKKILCHSFCLRASFLFSTNRYSTVIAACLPPETFGAHDTRYELRSFATRTAVEEIVFFFSFDSKVC
jgi:hypothetical protein